MTYSCVSCVAVFLWQSRFCSASVADDLLLPVSRDHSYTYGYILHVHNVVLGGQTGMYPAMRGGQQLCGFQQVLQGAVFVSAEFLRSGMFRRGRHIAEEFHRLKDSIHERLIAQSVGRHGVARYRGARVGRVNTLVRPISKIN